MNSTKKPKPRAIGPRVKNMSMRDRHDYLIKSFDIGFTVWNDIHNSIILLPNSFLTQFPIDTYKKKRNMWFHMEKNFP